MKKLKLMTVQNNDIDVKFVFNMSEQVMKNIQSGLITSFNKKTILHSIINVIGV